MMNQSNCTIQIYIVVNLFDCCEKLVTITALVMTSVGKA